MFVDENTAAIYLLLGKLPFYLASWSDHLANLIITWQVEGKVGKLCAKRNSRSLCGGFSGVKRSNRAWS